MLGFKSYQKTLHHSDDISHWTMHPGTQRGSNPAAQFTSSSGEKHYVKFYNNPEQAHAEVAAAKVYEHLGANTLKPKLVNYQGKVGVATKWRGDLRPLDKHDYDNPSEGFKQELAKHYTAGVLTKNWDAVGLHYDNIMKDGSGKLHTVDLGGALNFRAQGGPKHYDPDIGEHQTYHDRGLNPQAAHAFHSITDNHIRGALHGMANASNDGVHKIFRESGLPNAESHTASFVSRREKLRQAVGA
jgi:hypothetical protein